MDTKKEAPEGARWELPRLSFARTLRGEESIKKPEAVVGSGFMV